MAIVWSLVTGYSGNIIIRGLLLSASGRDIISILNHRHCCKTGRHWACSTQLTRRLYLASVDYFHPRHQIKTAPFNRTWKFFVFSFFSLFQHWPGKLIPSSIFPRPLLMGVTFSKSLRSLLLRSTFVTEHQVPCFFPSPIITVLMQLNSYAYVNLCTITLSHSHEYLDQICCPITKRSLQHHPSLQGTQNNSLF